MKRGLALSLSNGFTLIELMVGMAIFGVIIIVATGSLIQIIQESNRVTTNNELRQNGERIMADIGNEIRKSGCVTITHPCFPQINLNVVTIQTYSDKGCTSLVATYTSNSSAGIYTFTKGASAPVSLVAPKVGVIDCGQSSSSCGSDACSNGLSSTKNSCSNNVTKVTGSIDLSLTLQSMPGPTRSDFCGSVTLTDTFVPRN